MSMMAKVDKIKLRDGEACRRAAKEMGLACEAYGDKTFLTIRGSQLYFTVNLNNGEVEYDTDYSAQKSIEALEKFQTEYEIQQAMAAAEAGGLTFLSRETLEDGSVRVLWEENSQAAEASLG
jgi:hypothetical protein